MLARLLRCNRRPPASTYVPSVRALGMTGYAPTVSGTFANIPPVRAMGLTGHAPTIQRSSALSTTDITLTSEYYAVSSSDRYWGFGQIRLAVLIGAVSPTSMNGYDVVYLYERATNSGVVVRKVVFELRTTGKDALSQDSISSITTTIGGTLASSAASSFTAVSGGGLWQWTVTPGTWDTTSDYLSSGVVTVTV
jgi:hypothetical protein